MATALECVSSNKCFEGFLIKYKFQVIGLGVSSLEIMLLMLPVLKSLLPWAASRRTSIYSFQKLKAQKLKFQYLSISQDSLVTRTLGEYHFVKLRYQSIISFETIELRKVDSFGMQALTVSSNAVNKLTLG
jgi:hypothetical protein